MGSLAPSIPACTRHCLRQSSSHFSHFRCFTTSPVRPTKGSFSSHLYSIYIAHIYVDVLPTFSPTSDPALDALLTTFRQNIFLPSLLLRSQRALIYQRSKQHHLLGEDPVTVSLPTKTSSQDPAPETFTLTPLDRQKDEPKSRKTFHKVLSLIKEKRDWDVVPSFLKGLKISGRVVDGNMQEKLIRKAAEAGRMGLVIELLREGEKTGVGIDSVGVAREVMWGALSSAITSGWSKEDVKKATTHAVLVLELMEDPNLGVGKGVRDKMDPRKRPEVLAIVMGLKVFDGAQEKEVEAWAKRVLQTLENADTGVEKRDWRDANDKLMMWTPVRWGMKMALNVLTEEGGLRRRIETALNGDVQSTVEKALRVVRDFSPEGRRRGVLLYNDLEKSEGLSIHGGARED